jgi:2',3'-cyclic-nucleotide 2'-phosphodiesterase (5'-nucleotidase family)
MGCRAGERWARHGRREKWKVFAMLKKRSALLILAVVMAMIVPTAALAGNGNNANEKSASNTAEVTLLHTNDFHGNLETDYKARGGSAYMAAIINDVRSSVGESNVALLDAGDVYFA